jgi:hypothetical protein
MLGTGELIPVSTAFWQSHTPQDNRKLPRHKYELAFTARIAVPSTFFSSIDHRFRFSHHSSGLNLILVVTSTSGLPWACAARSARAGPSVAPTSCRFRHRDALTAALATGQPEVVSGLVSELLARGVLAQVLKANVAALLKLCTRGSKGDCLTLSPSPSFNWISPKPPSSRTGGGGGCG